MPGSGFITIDRDIQYWRWWGNPYATTIWLYILVNANWKEGWWGGGSVRVRRGEFVTSQRKMAEDLRMDKRTIRYWLKRFENDGQITLNVTTQFTSIFVINYEKYQDRNFDHVPPNAPPDVPLDAPADAHNRTRITKEQRNNNRESFVKPTLDELRAYIFENGFSVDPERFLDYYDSNGWKVGKSRMKDWKKAVNNWQRNEKPKKDGMDYPKEGNGYLW